ncbi:MAG: twin-arginine translocation signal domain-containing protein [Desulfuromonadaceae bacterium]|nr:twin-arginine translocation signal domain-containing protein [Desulfuromonadaceae bacterium]
MSQNDDNNKELEKALSKGMDRREFMKRTMVGAGAVAATMVVGGCGSSSTTAAAPKVAAAVPSKTAWKFAVMNDTQWTQNDDGKNPDSTPVDIITKLNQEFINHDVKFVVQTGDLTDDASSTKTYTVNKIVDGVTTTYTHTNIEAVDTRALFAQALYNAGIGFFPLRGNHEDEDDSATEIQRIFPQTQNGQMNATPADVLSMTNPDADLMPSPVKSGTTFTVGSNFSSPSSDINNLKGLSYSFDYGNTRFVLLDQFAPPDNKNLDGSDFSTKTAIAAQQGWIDTALAGKPSGGHAFVFSHKGLLTQSHIDVLFGDCPAAEASITVTPNGSTTTKTYVGSPGMDPFITSLQNNGARYLFCGHDHMHDRSLVATSDGTTAKVTQIVGASNSSKFYYPEYPKSNDEMFCGKKRQTLLSQELNTVGYTLVTVDGANVTMEFYSAPAYPTPVADGVIQTTPILNFSKRESFGYSLNGKQFVVASGESYTTVQDTSPTGGSTVVKVLAGVNGNAAIEPGGRFFNAAVNTGWLAAGNTASDILVLQGMTAQMGSKQTDIFAISLSYDKTKATDAQIQAGAFALSTPDGSSNWVNAVSLNSGGVKKFVLGPWKSSYVLGTYGVDTATNTVWAVINYNSYFAAVAGV